MIAICSLSGRAVCIPRQGSNLKHKRHRKQLPGNIRITAAIPQLRFAQSADTIIFVHEDLSRSSWCEANNSSWTNQPSHSLSVHIIHLRCQPAIPVNITPSATDGNVKITASSGVFASGNVHQYINVNSSFGRLRVVEFVSSTVNCVAEVPLFHRYHKLWQLGVGIRL